MESWACLSVHAQDQMRLSITRSQDSSVDCVQIQGDVDLRDCRELGLAARQLIEGDASTIYVDLGRVTLVSSILVGFLVQVGNAEDRARRHLVLCRPTPMARKVIHLTGLELFASVHPELPEPWPDISPVDSGTLPSV
jgi:anti-anti-sigma factor